MQWIIACLLVITAVTIYFPTVIIRKSNRILKVLDQIEANTRK